MTFSASYYTHLTVPIVSWRISVIIGILNQQISRTWRTRPTALKVFKIPFYVKLVFKIIQPLLFYSCYSIKWRVLPCRSFSQIRSLLKTSQTLNSKKCTSKNLYWNKNISGNLICLNSSCPNPDEERKLT